MGIEYMLDTIQTSVGLIIAVLIFIVTFFVIYVIGKSVPALMEPDE